MFDPLTSKNCGLKHKLPRFDFSLQVSNIKWVKVKVNKTYFLLNIFCLTDEIDKGMDSFIQFHQKYIIKQKNL